MGKECVMLAINLLEKGIWKCEKITSVGDSIQTLNHKKMGKVWRCTVNPISLSFCDCLVKTNFNIGSHRLSGQVTAGALVQRNRTDPNVGPEHSRVENNSCEDYFLKMFFFLLFVFQFHFRISTNTLTSPTKQRQEPETE